MELRGSPFDMKELLLHIGDPKFLCLNINLSPTKKY